MFFGPSPTIKIFFGGIIPNVLTIDMLPIFPFVSLTASFTEELIFSLIFPNPNGSLEFSKTNAQRTDVFFFNGLADSDRIFIMYGSYA